MKIGKFSIVSPEAIVSASAVICEYVLIRPRAIIRSDVILKPYAIVSADCIVGERTVIGPGAMLLHETHTGKHLPSAVGSDCFIGAGALILPGINICSHVIIGAGSVVTRSITEPGTYGGTPCRRLGYTR